MAALVAQFFSRLSISSSKYFLFTSVKPKLLSSTFCNNCRYLANAPTPYKIVDLKEEEKARKDVIANVNSQIAKCETGRLFAVVHVAGKQFKITEGDVIVIEGYWPPNVGDKISLDKVLLVGAKDFSLIGQPLVQRGLVQTEATVIEKTLSHTKTHFRKKRRKQYKRINFYRIPQTMLRINKIQLVGEVDNPPDVTGLEKVIL